MHKRLLCPGRRRNLPPHFSWIDHRFIRDGHIARCGPTAVALYLVLIAVGDALGLSYYSDASLCRLLQLHAATLARARQNLIDAQLIAYEKPLYQVLDLPPLSPPAPTSLSPPTPTLCSLPAPATAKAIPAATPPRRSRTITPIGILIDQLLERNPHHD